MKKQTTDLCPVNYPGKNYLKYLLDCAHFSHYYDDAHLWDEEEKAFAQKAKS